MVVGLTFNKNADELAASLSEVKIITLTDQSNNTYTLDVTGSTLALKYKPQTGSEITYNVNGLVPSITNLLTTNSGEKEGERDITILEKEAANKDVAEAVLSAKFESGPNKDKNIAEVKLGNAFVKTADLEKSTIAGKVFDAKFESGPNKDKNVAEVKLGNTFAKTDGSNINPGDQVKFAEKILGAQNAAGTKTVLAEKVADKDVAEAVLGATKKDANNKDMSILAKKLGGFLTSPDTAKYDDTPGATEQTAKAFLESKGLMPSVDAVAVLPALQSGVAIKLLDDTNKTKLGQAILGVKKEVDGTQKPALETNLAANTDLQTAVAGNDTLKTAMAKPAAIAAIPALQTAVAGNADLQKAVAKNTDLQTAVAADPGLKQAVTNSGIAANEDVQKAVATKLLDDTNKTKLGQAILDVKKEVSGTQKPALETNLAANTDLQTAVAGNDTLKTAIAKPADIAAIPTLQKAVAANSDLRAAVKGALADDATFQGAVKIEVNAEEPGFQGAVRGVMSKPVFEIPTDETAPLSWDW